MAVEGGGDHSDCAGRKGFHGTHTTAHQDGPAYGIYGMVAQGRWGVGLVHDGPTLCAELLRGCCMMGNCGSGRLGWEERWEEQGRSNAQRRAMGWPLCMLHEGQGALSHPSYASVGP